MRRYSILWRTTAGFLTFAAALALGLGILIYTAADNFARFLIQQQVQPVMAALVAAERRWRDGPDRQTTDGDIAALAQAVGATFLVGKEIPSRWRASPQGLHILPNARFVYLVREDGIAYVLHGSSRPVARFLSSLAGHLLFGGLLGLAGAVLAAFFLGRHLAAPLVRLARAIDAAPPGEIAIPDDLLKRCDEIGCVARSMAEHGRLAQEYCRREAAFTGDVSHELRTPLAVLSGTAEILSARANDEFLRKIAARLQRTVAGMGATVQALLSLARETAPEPRPLDMAQIATEQLESLMASGVSAGQVNMDLRAKPSCLGLEDLAAAAVGNILANACRYSTDGRVSAVLAAESFTVSNRGRLAEKSSCLDSCGLGLSIAARACAKMGWKLTIREEDGMVTVYIVWPDEAKSA